MSKLSLVGGDAGLGEVLLHAPETDETRIYDFPDETGTFALREVDIANLETAKANRSGDTFTGQVNFESVVTVQTPTDNNHAVTKKYVDDQISELDSTISGDITDQINNINTTINQKLVLATTEEAIAGTDASKLMTPATTKSAIDANSVKSDEIRTIVLDMFFPVGSVYITMNNVDPNTQFGGTWVRIQNRFLLGSGSRSNRATGGSETVSLSTSNMPSHSHSVGSAQRITGYFQAFRGNGGQVAGGAFTSSHVTTGGIQGGGYQETDRFDFDSSRSTSGNTGSAGSGSSFNIMNPYIVCTMWERTA